MAWVYKVNSTAFYHEEKFKFFARYAGAGKYRNESQYECKKNLGALPRGKYIISKPMHHHATAGIYVLRLTPDKGNHMCGRDGFLIHGNNKTDTASTGCIILDRQYREVIAKSGDNVLVVE